MTDGNSAISPRAQAQSNEITGIRGLCGLPICKATQCGVNGWGLVGGTSSHVCSTSAAVEKSCGGRNDEDA